MRTRSGWHLPVILFGALLAAGVAVALVYLLATEEAPTRGGTLVEGIAGTPMSLNPLLATFNDTDRDLTSLLFSGLTQLRADGSVAPDLAAEWEIGNGGRSYTFRLKPNLRWHDGNPVTAGDVAFTFGLLGDKDFPGNPELGALWRRVTVEALGPAEVRFTLEQPFAPFLSYTTTGILPKHVFGNTAARDIPAAGFSQGPVGNGPFRLAKAGLSEVTLEANPESPRGRPLLDRVQFKFLPDEQALAAALGAGQVEAGLLRPSLGGESLEHLRSTAKLHLYAAPRSSYSLLFLNTRSPLFSDKAVRRALAYSIDREKLVREVVQGQGIAADSPFAPDSWARESGTPTIAHDPVRAAQLLEEGGWKLNAAGVREKGDQALKFPLMTNDDKVRTATAHELAKQLQQVGVQAEVVASGVTPLVQNFVLPRKFDAMLYGIDPGYDPDPYPLWHSSQATGQGLNLSVFGRPEVDTLLEQARTASAQDERRDLYRRFEATFAEEVPAILLYHPVYTYALDEAIKGVSVGVLYDTSSRFRNITEWHKETRRIFRTP